MIKRARTTNFLFLQLALIFMSFSGVCLKFASGYDFLSFWNLFFYGLAILILGIYAILWQRILAVFKLSFAYANKGISQIWTLIWSWLIFSEEIKLKTILGAAVIIAGVVLLVQADNE